MANTATASAYFLTCCRPIHNSFCFLVETPKFINFYNYPLEFFFKNTSGCKLNHDHFIDHSLNVFGKCTDDRAWSLDPWQRRQHFNDLVNGRIPHCEPSESSQDKGENSKEKPSTEKTHQDLPIISGEDKKKKKHDQKDDDDKIGDCPPDDLQSNCSSEEKLPLEVEDLLEKKSEEDSSEEKLPSTKSKEYVPSLKSKESEKLKSVPSLTSEESGKIGLEPSLKSTRSEEILPSVKSIGSDKLSPSVKSTESENLEQSLKSKGSEKLEPSLKSKGSEKLQPSVKSVHSKPGVDPTDVVGLTDELIEKLDRNLRNLESTFDKFVKKNRDFIQNLVECLDFEKQKQKALEDDYNKLKQENEELKTQNDYLKMVNNKQLDLFKNELDKGINENKVIYKRKIHLMERQLQNDQNELQMYKQTEKKYMEVVEQDNEKIEKLNKKIDDLKTKEIQLVRNYLQLLRFLENVKNILSNADPKEIPQLRSLNTITDTEGENNPDVKRVLRSALRDGISTLNVRDLSILHDAIEGLNDSLCHQTDKCTKSPTADSSYPDFSNMNIQRVMITMSREDFPKGYDTTSYQSIDRIPTKQKPEDRKVKFT